MQSFTVEELPVVGLLDSDRNLWGMAGFCGRGNCHVNPHHRLAECPRPDLRRGRMWSVRPILSYPSPGRLVGGAERPLRAG